MSILDRQPREEIAPAVRKARKVLRVSAALFEQLLTTWEQSVKDVWENDTAAILAEFGTNAAEVFRVSAETVAFLEKLKPGCTTDGRALLRPYTQHPDGTITLD